MTYDDLERKYWMGMSLNLLILFSSLILFSINFILGFVSFLLFTIVSYYFGVFHNKRLDILKKQDPCHAVWSGDSYFFNSMTVEDGYFNREKLYKDKKGLFVYRDIDSLVGVTTEEFGSKQYLPKYVQEAYFKYKENEYGKM